VRPRPTAEASGDPRWHQLVRYHLLAVQRASAAEPVPVTSSRSWTTLPVRQEQIITGRGDELIIGEGLGDLFREAGTEEAVYYGWPLVIVVDRSGRPHAAPLLMTELEPPIDGSGGACVPRDDEPYVNPGLLIDDYFAPDALAAAEAHLASGLPFGDAEALRMRVVEVLRGLGLETGPLDVDALAAQGGVGRLAPGVHNVAMAFRGPSTLATRALRQELEELRSRDDWHGTGARWLVERLGAPGSTAARSRSGSQASAPALRPVLDLPPVTVDGLHLNDAQEQALAAALRDDVTVVTGPPGTGKSQLVAAIVANQWLAGRSVLVASTNNGAVDVAVERSTAIDPALLLRTGSAERRESLPVVLEQLAGRGVVSGPSLSLIRRQVQAAATARETVLGLLADRSALDAEAAQLQLDVEALRTLLWGSPLPGPAHDERHRAQRMAVRAAHSRWFRAVRIRRLLVAAGPTQPGARWEDVAEWATSEVRLDALLARLAALGPADADADRRDLAAAQEAWALAGTKALVDTVQRALSAGRTALQQLARLRPHARSARAAAVARTLPHTPGWACTALSARANFPLEAGLFDLLVVDEASQCSVAELLPLAYRARRVVVVGDPNQLAPVVTLTRPALESIALAAGSTHERLHAAAVSAGADSAFTAYAAAAPAALHLLDEHYRCHPDIARFVNEEFYGGALRVLTDVSRFADADPRGLSLVDVRGLTERGAAGGARNRAEADAVVAWVLEHAGTTPSLGVVTPFAGQAALIRELLSAALGHAAQDVTVGTAHRFQGDERDVILFSTVISAEARPGTVRWVEEQRNLVNVAASRARRALVVFADTAAISAVAAPTLQVLVDMARGVRAEGRAGVIDLSAEALREDAGLHSEAERRLYAALRTAGAEVVLKPIVEGYELDFALDTAAGPLDVEVDGVHHTDARGRQRRQDLARDQVVQGLGWSVLRIPAWECLATPDAAAARVLAAARAVVS